MESLEENLRIRICIEILFNLSLIPEDVYDENYSDNAEILDRDYDIWKNLYE